jgi:hypothetical protein
MFVQSLVTPRMYLQYFKLSFYISHSLKISNIGRVFLFCVMFILNNYCTEWCIEVNVKKTKVIIFNKTGRLMNDRFNIRTDTLECVKQYKYLQCNDTRSSAYIEGKEFSHHLELLNVLSSMMLGRSFMNILKRLGLKTRPV